MRTKLILAAACCVAAITGSAALGELAPEQVGEIAGAELRWAGSHVVWVGDMLLRRSALFDADDGEMIGSVYAGQDLSPVLPIMNAVRRELYVASTYYSRRSHGERTDALVIYDAERFAPVAEVVLPPKKASNGNGVALAALLDDDRFVVVFNQTPVTSVSVVDVEQRKFVGEIDAAGCALVYPAGPRRFGMLCADGTALAITLDENGAEASRAASAKFFDAASDPVTEKGVRLDNHSGRWLFVSFDGFAHEVDFGAEGGPVAKEPWSLFTEEERAEGWRIGGRQHLAYHAERQRLYSLVHRGEPNTHKHAGTEIWVYRAFGRHEKFVIELPNLSAHALRGLIGVEPGGFADWLLQWLVPNAGADSVVVTQDAHPLLIVSNADAPAVGVLDAGTGDELRVIEEPGLAVGMLVAP